MKFPFIAFSLLKSLGMKALEFSKEGYEIDRHRNKHKTRKRKKLVRYKCFFSFRFQPFEVFTSLKKQRSIYRNPIPFQTSVWYPINTRALSVKMSCAKVKKNVWADDRIKKVENKYIAKYKPIFLSYNFSFYFINAVLEKL